ncbi:hypothetical protein AMAG_12756 [Allomyces macrogynus ATCC 38327]|uniref:Uncharacterized protein n=1 Tax=Allomyces macrogynus (strain ATCC 38327) TaxID=578462 RepID=A0A0L0T1Y9_ALLM3|nr:hypothetical protein AMAG_12756 [Allomyces macrogynus ATCC 38327]|eukprot:KNE68589.1 hypothetical protein AMAG_12756 [Allomyces macrogynus ATCC 38327]
MTLSTLSPTMMANGANDPELDGAPGTSPSTTNGKANDDAPVYRAREGDALYYTCSVYRPLNAQLDDAADTQFDDADNDAGVDENGDEADGWKLVKVIHDTLPFTPILHEWGRGLVLNMDEKLVGLAVGDKASFVQVGKKANWNPFDLDLPVEALDVDGDFRVDIEIIALIPQDATFAARLHPIHLSLTTGDALHDTCHDPTSVLSRYMLGLTLAQHLAADLASIHDDAFQPDLARIMALSLTLTTRAAAAALAIDELDAALALLVDFFAAVESPETSELGKEYTAPLPGGALLAVFGRLEVERYAVEVEVVARAAVLWCECLERMGEGEMAVECAKAAVGWLVDGSAFRRWVEEPAEEGKDEGWWSDADEEEEVPGDAEQDDAWQVHVDWAALGVEDLTAPSSSDQAASPWASTTETADAPPPEPRRRAARAASPVADSVEEEPAIDLGPPTLDNVLTHVSLDQVHLDLMRAFAPYTLFPVPSVVAWCLTNYPALRPWLNDQPTETRHRLVALLLDALFTAGALRVYATVKSAGRPVPRGYNDVQAELRDPTVVRVEYEEGDEVDDELPPFVVDDSEPEPEELMDDDEEREGDATTVLAMADAGTYYKFCVLPHSSSPRPADADLDSAVPPRDTDGVDLSKFLPHLSVCDAHAGLFVQYAPMQAYRVDKVWNYLTSSHAGVQKLCAWVEAGKPEAGVDAVADSGVEVEGEVGMVRNKKKRWVPTLTNEQVALRRKVAGAYLRRMVEMGRVRLLPKPVPGAAWKVCLMEVEDVEGV